MIWIIITALLTLYSSTCYYYYHNNNINNINNNIKESKNPEIIRNKRICLLIAHPDDEAMFFAPTLLALTRPHLQNHITLLCLSSGNSEGIGHIRTRELTKSAATLGLRDDRQVLIIDSPDFPDSITTTWNPSKIADILHDTLITNTNTNTTPLDLLITFDASGISQHPNHISLYHGAKLFIARFHQQQQQHNSLLPSLFTLSTVSLFRKYVSFLDLLPSVIDVALADWQSTRTPVSPDHHHHHSPPKTLKTTTTLLFRSGPDQRQCAQDAMRVCHQSQMKWFRWGWILLSRYMVINDLRLEPPVHKAE